MTSHIPNTSIGYRKPCNPVYYMYNKPFVFLVIAKIYQERQIVVYNMCFSFKIANIDNLPFHGFVKDDERKNNPKRH